MTRAELTEAVALVAQYVMIESTSCVRDDTCKQGMCQCALDIAAAALAVVAEAMRVPDAKMVSAAYRTEGHSRAAAAIWAAMLAASPLAEDKP